MEISGIKEAFETFSTAISVLRSAKDLLPDSKEKKEAEEAVEKAASTARLAESQAAQVLGYPLCRCSWPPTIMVAKIQGGRQSVYHCATCNREFLVGQSGQIKGPYNVML
jgi:hypothetical protein